MSKKVILDTDIGSDIDDAVALSYLLARPDCELLGITTVSGEPVERARLASALCTRVGRGDILIYPGCPKPLLGGEVLQPAAPQKAVLPRFAHRDDFPAVGEHLRFMAETVRRYPGEVTLFAIGPMTNVAALFAAYPDVPELLGGLVMMIGCFGEERACGGLAEWNVRCDPYAAAAVYSSPVKSRSVGLDVTLKVTMPADEVRRRFTAGALPVALEMAEVWFRTAKVITFHDPLAAVTLFNDDVCGFERGEVLLDLSSAFFKGAARFTPDPAGRHEVAVSVSPERFFDAYFGEFGGRK